MYRANYINSLLKEMLEIVADQLTPAAMRYGYSDVPLEGTIKWKPLVLVLGSYSSGKSTLINDFLGASIQATGQAPTDDAFTVITYDDRQPPEAAVQTTETHDGKFLLNDPEYPFESLKKHGQRFAAHFRLKKVNSPFLQNLAIIDTPGMLDSIAERDRGYDYQQVIGELAQIADLVLVLFDSHKAGTVREIHTSLRETLPAHTFEDRVVFVLNRIDECASLIDLLRVYGTLCWNLSQITGRKDIPMIHLTYSAQEASAHREDRNIRYLDYLENQREELKKSVLDAPRHRLDNLAAFVETHSERLSHFLEALLDYRSRARRFRIKSFFWALAGSATAGAALLLLFLTLPPLAQTSPVLQAAAPAGVAVLLLLLWALALRRFFFRRFHRNILNAPDLLTSVNNQTRRDNWELIRARVGDFLARSGGLFSLRVLRRDYLAVQEIRENATKEIRQALKELPTLHGSTAGAHALQEEVKLRDENLNDHPA